MHSMHHWTHYCIFCGSAGDYGSKCERHDFCRGKSNLRPCWSMGMGSWMGQKLAYISFPWIEDPNAPYVPAPGEWPRKRSWPAREYVECIKLN